MREYLLSLEKKLFQFQYISDRNWLDAILHDAFVECGQSGRLFYKQETINTLLLCLKDRDIVIYNFDSEPLDENCWLVHYITKGRGQELIYRTSIWVMEEQMKLRFHQASCLHMDVALAEC